MMITKTSMFTGVEHTLDLPITQEDLDLWHGGKLIQNVFPHLTADQREFLMTGVTGEEWAHEFKDEDDMQAAMEAEAADIRRAIINRERKR